ncbi:MAG: hypothetical protein JO329_10790, partial [Planctomycetaceae bacterium]|nr:hypothetical protein [Planctomycetaceae bacterium]
MSGRLCTPEGRSRATPGDVPLWDTETVTATGPDAAEDVPPEGDTTDTGAAEDVPPEGDATDTAWDVPLWDTETVTATGPDAAEDVPCPIV